MKFRHNSRQSIRCIAMAAEPETPECLAQQTLLAPISICCILPISSQLCLLSVFVQIPQHAADTNITEFHQNVLEIVYIQYMLRQQAVLSVTISVKHYCCLGVYICVCLAREQHQPKTDIIAIIIINAPNCKKNTRTDGITARDVDYG